ncbi:MAG: protein jag [Candidatus Levyibacteriota bacterium]
MNKEKIVKETAEKILELLGVSATVDVTSGDEAVEVVMQTEETGMLIGYHGETLEALQLVLSLCVAKAAGEFIRVSVEIGDYKKNRIDYLNQLVAQAKEQVMTEGKEVTLPNLKSWERRVVHMLLQDDKDVISESVGEGRDRVLTIRPK